jgi:hypothetical protein
MSDLPGDYAPDGRQLVFKRATGENAAPLLIVDVAGGGEPQPISEDAFEDSGRFSLDGGSLLTSVGGRIKLIDSEWQRAADHRRIGRIPVRPCLVTGW